MIYLEYAKRLIVIKIKSNDLAVSDIDDEDVNPDDPQPIPPVE